MPSPSRPEPSTDPAPDPQAGSGSLLSRVSSAVLGNLLRIVRFLRRLLESTSPNV